MKRIAMIEDNEDNRMFLSAVLEDFYHIEEFESGIPALEALPHSLPDLVLLDITLPDMSGIEVLKKIRESEVLRSIPVIALTAHNMPGDKEKYLNHGFDDYIPKPIVDIPLFYEKIHTLLSVT